MSVIVVCISVILVRTSHFEICTFGKFNEEEKIEFLNKISV
jgi:hypothetical protein